MNLKCGFRRITLVSAILVAIICGGTSIGILIDKRSSALRHLAKCEEEFRESIPAMTNGRPAGWPEWARWPEWSPERHSSFSDYLYELSMFLFVAQVNLPRVYRERYEEEKKYKEEHNIPFDSTDRFYTDEAMKTMRKYGTCFKKAGSLLNAHDSCPAVLPIVLISLGFAIAGFCCTWFIFGIVRWLVVGFHQDIG